MAKGLYIHLHNFEGSGKTAKIPTKALMNLEQPKKEVIKRETKTIAGKIGKKFQKPMKRRNGNAREIFSEVEKKQK